LPRCWADLPAFLVFSRPAETIEIAPPGAFDPSTVDMPRLLAIGSSRTRITELPDGTRRGFTARHHPAS
jgi:hypothetical protein